MMRMKNRFKAALACMVLVLFMQVPPSIAQSRSLGLIRDTEIENILREWATPVFQVAGLNPQSVNIILVRSDDVNAFVAGGSNIFFYTGLISKTKGPGELIGVLAHETGHITGGHLIRTRDALERASYESIIGTLLGIGAAIATGDGGAAAALSAGGSSIAQRRFLAHSRVQESSADQAALTLMEKAKMNPTGLATFMETLKSDQYVPETQQSEYVRTHPLTGNRIEALMRRIEKSKYKDKPYNNKWIEQHARMKAKLVGFITPRQIAWVYDDRDQSIPAAYARAIAAYRLDQVDNALKQMDALLMKEPNNPYFLELKGQMLVDFGRVAQAVPYYKKALKIMPNAPLFRIALGHALIESGGERAEPLKQAIENLQRALKSEPRSSRIHRLLATAYGRLKQHDRAKIHLAEEALLQRRFRYARQHAEGVLSRAKEGGILWLKAKDIMSFIETVDKK